MTGLGPPLPPRLTPLVGVIVCNARAAPRPTPAGAPGPLQREPRAKEANYFLIVDTDNLTVSLPHNSCPPVYSRVSVDPSFPSFFFFSGPPRCLQSLMHTGPGLFFFSFFFLMPCWQDLLCSAHAPCIPAGRAINNPASRHGHNGRV